MYCCTKCGAVIDLGFTERDCPRGCFDEYEDDEDDEDDDDANVPS